MTADNTPLGHATSKAGGSALKGYYATDLHDMWQRYLPPAESALPPLPGTSEARDR